MEQKSVWSNIKTELQILHKYPELTQVTTDNFNPIPGYLFGEVNAFTFANDGMDCKQLIDHFMIQLQSNSAFVKMKVLKMLLYLVKNGHQNVIQEVKLYEFLLKETTSFSGTPDQFHGRTFYEIVRASANELLGIIFSEEAEGSSENTSKGASKLTGYGSEASIEKFAGFGNTVNQSKTIREQVAGGINSLVNKVLSPDNQKEYYSKQSFVLDESLPKYKPISVEKNNDKQNEEFTVETLHSSNQYTRQKAVHISGKAGGGWEDSDDDDDVENLSENLTLSCKDSVELNVSADSLDNNPGVISNVEWCEENEVINAFAVNESLTKLKLKELNELCKRCSVLDCEEILKLALDKVLRTTMENIKLRCLVLVEYLIHQDIANVESVAKFTIPTLEKISESDSPPVSTKSKKICLIISKLNEQQCSSSKNSENLISEAV